MTLVASGVIANFILKLIRWKVNDKQTTLQNIENAEDTARQAYNAGKTNNKKYTDGIDLLKNSKGDFHKGKYNESSRKAIWAKDLFITAVSSTEKDGQSEDSKGEPPKILLTALVGVSNPSTTREILSALSDFKRSEYVVYGGLSLVLALSVLQVWQLFYPTVAAFGASGIDYVAAFFFGYANLLID